MNRIFVSILRPPALVSEWADAAPLTPPLGPAYLVGSLKESGFEAEIIDAIGEAPKKVVRVFDDRLFSVGLTPDEMVDKINPKANILGVSATFSHDWPMVKEVVRLARKRFPKALIIGGGEHFTALPEFSLHDCQEIDLCVLGEGEETIVEITEAFDTGRNFSGISGIVYRESENKIIQTQKRSRIQKLDEIAKPNWESVPLENYLRLGLSFGVNLGRTIPLLATRGCPYQCTFCSSPTMWTTKWLTRDPNLVLDEIEEYMEKYRATNFDFYDLTMIVKRDWILQFTSEIERRGLKFTWQLPSGTRSEAIDEEVARALYRTGCRNISYAPESGSERELKRIKKRINLSKMLRSMRLAVRNKLNIKTNMIVGFPEETRFDVFKTLLFLVKMAVIGVQDVSISMFSAYPGSALFSELVQKKKIGTLDEKYFLSLSSYKDLLQSANWSESIRPLELRIYRLLGYALFYGFNYLLRPWRVINTFVNVLRGKEVSRLEKSVLCFFQRRHDSRGDSQPNRRSRPKSLPPLLHPETQKL